ncbi:SCF ubiquitin ligase complex subunit [Batrachochytrium dendrobatidis]|nr:SCF ubiquitin ligase complex subunit [Batrachochytrium dendrobatidis]KAK5665097.1 SCF ubiquitin ligase complex subunit [Batrachochytrium dendrobatidis]
MDISIRGFLEDHLLFKEYASNTGFIDTLTNLMKTRVFSDGAYVIRKGEVGRAMFFVLRGEVEVISEDGETIINVLKEQSFFGEIGLLFSIPRTVSCRARGRSILLVLTKESLEKAVEPYPRIAVSIAQIAEERYTSHIKQVESSVQVEFGEELKIGVTQQDLKTIPLFRDCEIGFLHNLALSLRPVNYTNDQLIIQKGEMASEMFFVVRGVAEVFNETTNQVFAQFHPGSFFGEVGLFFSSKRSASVRCATRDVTVFKLYKKDLDSLLENYPEVKMKIEKEASQRLQYIESREKANLDKAVHDITDVEVVREKLKTVPLFRNTPTAFLHQIVLASRIFVAEKNSIIIKKGEIGRSMYFVIDGAVQVVSEDAKQVYVQMDANSFFGEVSLFYEVNRTATVCASSKTTLVELSNDTVQSILKTYPNLMGQIHERAKDNYTLFMARQKALQEHHVPDSDKHRFDIEATVSRLRKVPIFEKCNEGFLGTLALSTSIRTLKEGDLVISAGQPSLEMYFLAHGQVEIVSDDGNTVYDQVFQGGFFGEVGVVRGVNRTASVRVKSTVCRLLVLSADAMRKALKQYPDNFQMISLEADKRFRLAEGRVLPIEHALTHTVSSGLTQAQKPSTVQSSEAGLGNAMDIQKSAEKERSSNGSAVSSMIPFGQLFSKRRRSSKAKDNSKPSKLKEFSRSISQDSIPDPAVQSGMSTYTLHQSDLPITSIVLKDKETSTHVQRALGKMLSTLKNTLSSSAEFSKARSMSAPVKYHTMAAKQWVVPIKFREEVKRKLQIPPHKTLTSITDATEAHLEIIFSYVLPSDMLRLRGVCRRWNEILLMQQFWRVLNLRSEFRKIDRKALEVFAYLGSETLTMMDLTGCWMIVDNDIRTLVTRCRNIQCLNVSNCWKLTDIGLIHLAKGCPELVKLDISHCSQISGIGFNEHIWSNMKSINISYCKVISDEQLERLLPGTPEMQDIKMRRCQRISDFGVFLIVQYCRRLRSLDMRDSDHITDTCLKWIASSCYNLTDLNLTFCSRITNGGMYDLSLGSQSFTRLQFTACEQLTDASIIYFSASIRNLKFISLRQCRKMTDRVTGYLAQSCATLKEVDVTGCPNITEMSRLQLQAVIPSITVKINQSPESRKIVQPGQQGKPKAIQVPLSEVFTSGPKEMMATPKKSKRSSGKKNLNLSGSNTRGSVYKTVPTSSAGSESEPRTGDSAPTENKSRRHHRHHHSSSDRSKLRARTASVN